MKQNSIAGFVLTCVGDNRAYSFMPSRLGDTLSDKIASHIITHFYPRILFNLSYRLDSHGHQNKNNTLLIWVCYQSW